MFFAFFFLSIQADDTCLYGHKTDQVNKDSFSGENYCINEAYFDSITDINAWGGCIFLQLGSPLEKELSVTLTTFVNPTGNRGAVLFTYNVKSTLKQICCFGATLTDQNKDKFDLGMASFYSSQDSNEFSLSQSSIVSGNEDNADRDLVIDLQSSQTNSLNTCNLTDLKQQNNIIKVNNNKLEMSYSSFCNLITSQTGPIIFQDSDGSLTIESCTFFKLDLAVESKTPNTQVQNSYFYEVKRLLFNEGTTIINCFVDKTLITNIPDADVHDPTGSYPPNFYENYSPFYYGDLTEE